ncbi:MAG: diguanylate cyclase [Actinobacteria bacterium]|nr:diguanylate cyclase [Actinomycetota bacterium]
MRQDSAGRRRVALAAGLGVTWLVFYAGWLAVRPGGDRVLTVFSDTAYLVPLLAATVFSAYAWMRAPRELRAFWGLMTAACAAWLFADALWCARDLIDGSVPYPWWTDAGYLTSDALMFLAVYTAFRPRLRAVPVSRILDGLIVVAALALLWWWLLIHPVALTSELESLVTTAYPVFGLAVIGMLIATRLLPARNGTLAMRLVALGVTCSVLANALYVHVNLSSGYISGDWIELGWEAQGILFAVAAVVSAQGIGRPRNWMRFRENGELGSAFILTGALAVCVIALAMDGSNGELSVGLISGVVALSALVIARVWLALAPARGGQALRDGRTGAYSADTREQVRSFMIRARHFGEPFAVALAAVDNCHGRNDDLDTALAERLTAAAREVDVVASTGDGHFAVAMPNVEPDEAIAIAERLRHAVAAEPLLVAGQSCARTVSFGLATGTRDDDDRSLSERADDNLAAAQRLGGNQVRSATDHLLLFSDHPLDGERLELFAALAELVDDREGPDPQHSHMVASLASILAAEMGLDAAAVSRSYLAGLLHDIGKLALPEGLLQKPGPLDSGEWDDVREHSSVGAQLVARMTAVRDAAPIVAAHHGAGTAPATRAGWPGTTSRPRLGSSPSPTRSSR